MADDRKYKKALSKTLKMLRGTRTQKEVAEAARIPTSTWCKIEQGRQLPRDETFVRIAGALGCSVTELEHYISKSTLDELVYDGQPATNEDEHLELRQPPLFWRRRQEGEPVDLEGLPDTAARRIANTLDSISSLRNHLEVLEREVVSLGHEARTSMAENPNSAAEEPGSVPSGGTP